MSVNSDQLLQSYQPSHPELAEDELESEPSMPATTCQNMLPKGRFAHAAGPQIKAESILYDCLCPIVRSPTVGCRKPASFSLCKEQPLQGNLGNLELVVSVWLVG